MKYNPHNYQKYAIEFIKQHPIAAILRPMVKRVVGLTGTPSSNGLMDLFAEFKVLDMGERLGRFIGQYRVNYFKPDRMNGPISICVIMIVSKVYDKAEP